MSRKLNYILPKIKVPGQETKLGEMGGVYQVEFFVLFFSKGMRTIKNKCSLKSWLS